MEKREAWIDRSKNEKIKKKLGCIFNSSKFKLIRNCPSIFVPYLVTQEMEHLIKDRYLTVGIWAF